MHERACARFPLKRLARACVMTSVEFPARDVARVAKLSLPFPKGDMRGRIAREGTREHNMLPLILLQQEIKRKGRREREEGGRQARSQQLERPTLSPN